MSTINKETLPESVRGLVNKTKTELLNIIARKDVVESDIKHHLSAKMEEISLLKANITERDTKINNLLNSNSLLEKKYETELKNSDDWSKKHFSLNEAYINECNLRKQYAQEIIKFKEDMDKLLEERNTNLQTIEGLENDNADLAKRLLETNCNSQAKDEDANLLKAKYNNMKATSVIFAIISICFAVWIAILLF